MRVALLTFYPVEAGMVPGGVRMVSHNLVRELRRDPELELHVLHCHSDIQRDWTVTDGNLTIHYLGTPRGGLAPRLVPNLTTAVRRLIAATREIAPDLVHAHAGHFAYAGWRSGYPTVYTIHGVISREREIYSGSFYDRLRYGLLAAYEARALRRVDHLVAISGHVREAYAASTRGRPWTRIENPVPDAFFELPDRAEAGRVLFAGSITEIKDLLTLMRAIDRVRRAYSDVRLRVAGRVTSEVYDQLVRACVTRLGLGEHVRFLGLLDREAIMHEYARAAVVALTSVQENAPMAVIEGMAAARPVVATRVGGVPELVREGETGYLCDAGDDATIAERLLGLLRDRDKAQRMGARGRAIAQERFSAAKVARAYQALYDRVTDASRGAPHVG